MLVKTLASYFRTALAPLGLSRSLAPFVPTPLPTVRVALGLAGLGPRDVLFEIGCGDARLCIEAARQHAGLRCVGIEYDQDLAEMARRSVAECPASVRSRIEIRCADATATPLDGATVAFLYLSERGNRQMLPRLRGVAPLRVLSFNFAMPAPLEPTHSQRLPCGQDLHVYEL